MLRCLLWLTLAALLVESSPEYVKAIKFNEIICSASLCQHPTDHIWMPYAVQRGFGGQCTWDGSDGRCMWVWCRPPIVFWFSYTTLFLQNTITCDRGTIFRVIILMGHPSWWVTIFTSFRGTPEILKGLEMLHCVCWGHLHDAQWML